MKKTLMIVAAAAFMMGSSVAMAKPFCASCHAGHKNKVGPAFATVVEAYGSVDAVFEFLNSDAALEPKVEKFASKKGMMKGQLKKYRKLNDAKKAEVRAWFEEQIK
ncbi:MAG: c-type cytochrome [Mariprofundus sp.]